MRNPILKGSAYKFYALVMTIVMLVHGAVLYFYYDYSISVSLVDSLIYNLIFGAIAPGFWYIVIYAGSSKDELALIGTHLGAAFLSVLLWSSLSGYFVGLIFSGHSDYLQFVDESYVWRFIIGVVFYCLTILIFYLVKYYQDMQARVNRELELQALLKDSELRMLKSQINPHFIFNSLNSISALTITKPDTAREMVIKLSDFLRYSLGKNNSEMNTLEQEIQNLSLYMDIEKTRFGSKLMFEKEVDEACLSIKVPNLIMQPLIENAIKFGVYDSTEQVTIQLNCAMADNILQIKLHNSIDASAVPSKGEGIGLENVRKRLNLVYDRSDLLVVNKGENEFNVLLKIPVIEEYEQN